MSDKQASFTEHCLECAKDEEGRECLREHQTCRRQWMAGFAAGASDEREECAKRLEALAAAAPSSHSNLRAVAADIRARSKP